MDLNSLFIADSEDKNRDQEEFGFFIRDGKYYIIKREKESSHDVEQSNFVMKSIYHLANGSNNSQRIIYLQRNTGEKQLIEVYSSELKPESFETVLKSNRCTFFGSSYTLKRIFSRLMDLEDEATILHMIGWNAEHRLYVFADAIFDGSLKMINSLGIIETAARKFYLPAFGFANIHNEDWKSERLYMFREGKTDFRNWARLFYDAYGSNGAIGIVFTILSIFRDVVFDQVGFFPFLFLFGDFGTGKTSYTEKLLSLFGKDVIGIPLNNATTVALSRIVSSRINSMFYFKEYTNETDESAGDFILTSYDGAGRKTGLKTTDNKTKDYPVRSAIIFDGNHLPTQKSAILSRMILLNFESSTFTGKETEAFNQLKVLADEGFGNVLLEILQLRSLIEEYFRTTFLETARKIKNSGLDFPDRTINHLALLVSVMEIVGQRLELPFEINEFKRIIIENAENQKHLLEESSAIHIFWESFAYGIKRGFLTGYSDGIDGAQRSHYRLKEEENKKVLQIKLTDIYPNYVRYCKENNLRFLDKSSLKMILTAKTNKTFIPNHQKGRSQGYTDKKFGFCYQFIAQSIENGIEINDVEINL